MSSRFRILITLVSAFVFVPIFVRAADDMQLYVPKSRAPADVNKSQAAKDRLSKSDIREIDGEFHGLLHMALKKYANETWEGKSISDCRPETSGNACDTCDLIMGHTSATYYFYKDLSPNSCTLQQVDIHFQVSDPAILKVLKRSGQDFFGVAPVRADKPESTESGWEGSGTAWMWQTTEDWAFLYMDVDQGTSNGEGVARFQWRRTPLFKPSK